MDFEGLKRKHRVWTIENFHTRKENGCYVDVKCLKMAQELIKLVSFLILIIIFVITSAGTFGKYFARESYMETNVVSQNEALFPALTVCPITLGQKNDIFMVK